ncbi:MAG: hypothetical protein H5T86_15600 [Armatimonadetes bacterium]|nr:hypothetical protein [Armatimonadota bacterium]
MGFSPSDPHVPTQSVEVGLTGDDSNPAAEILPDGGRLGTACLSLSARAEPAVRLPLATVPIPAKRQLWFSACVKSAGSSTLQVVLPSACQSEKGAAAAASRSIESGEWNHVALKVAVPPDMGRQACIAVAAADGDLLLDGIEIAAGAQ